MTQITPDNMVWSAGFSRHLKPYYSARQHRLNRYLIRLQVGGSSRITINHITYTITPGDLVLVQPGDDYTLQIDEQPVASGENSLSTDYYLSCSGSWISAWWETLSPPRKARISIDDTVLGMWRRLVYEKRNISGDNTELLDYLSRVLCLLLARQLQSSRKSAGPDTYIPFQIKQYVEKRATEPLTLQDIARHLGVSVSSASHLFKATFNQPIMRYVVEVRLSIAAERMLISRLKLETIAEAAGFRSYPYFCRAFRARFGLSPSQYRAVNQKL